MLLIRSVQDRSRTVGDDGVALVLVLVVMIVGFIAAATVAAAVFFVISANSDNKSSTQAFIAAESGRDKVVSQIAAGCTDNTAMAASGTTPTFTAQAYSTTGDQPTSPTGLTASCPTKDSTFILIDSTGTGPNGTTSRIYSVYRWSATYSDVPGGVVTYFAGSVSQGVSHYTGDMVLRNGNWGCTVDGTLDGDLYVLSGTVSLSNNCRINGDVWANGAVSSNSSGWKIAANSTNGSPGNITTNGFVQLTSNGSPSVAGSISAAGLVSLTNQGSDTGTVGGTVKSQSTVSVGSSWTTGAVTQNSSTAPQFVPSLDWLLAATKWIDLNNTSGWGTLTIPNCNVLNGNVSNASNYIKGLLTAGTTPIAVDFTGCSKPVGLSLSAFTVKRDMVIIVNPGQKMDVSLSGLTTSGTHQLLLVHSDANLADKDADGFPKPTCGNGNQNDGFGTSSAISSDLHILVYSPCGLNGTVTASFSGQLYSNDTTNFHAGSAYTCTPMSWTGSTLTNLACAIKGPDGIIDDTTIVQKLGSLVNQTEQ